MSETMVSRVAQAIEEASELWALGTDNQAWEAPYEIMATIAIKAMKGASDAMVEAHEGCCGGDADEAGPDRIRECWDAMIDAALSEAEGDR